MVDDEYGKTRPFYQLILYLKNVAQKFRRSGPRFLKSRSLPRNISYFYFEYQCTIKENLQKCLKLP